MKNLPRRQQNGAVLLVALVMLLVVTLLTVTNMSGVTLEGRMTANRMENQQLLTSTESAIREAEKRYYSPGYVRDKLEHVAANCAKANIYKTTANKPCLIDITNNPNTTAYHTAMKDFLLNPIKFIKTSADHGNWTGALTDAASDTAFVRWMPYRGTVAGEVTKSRSAAYWNTTRIYAEGVNAEYGDALEGRGTYYYLVTGQAKDQMAIQSTIANIYLGVNN